MEIPEGVSRESAQQAFSLLATHHDVLRRMSALLSEEDEPVAPSVLAQLGRVEALWRHVEETWGLLTAEEVTRLTGGNPDRARSHTANLRRRRRLLGVHRGGSLRYPGFQFDDSGALRHAWERLAEVLATADWGPEEILLWAVSPTGWLDGAVPIDILDRDPDGVVHAARQVALGASG